MEAIQSRGLKLAGWVANEITDAMLVQQENIEALKERIPAPLLGVVPYMEKADAGTAVKYLQLERFGG